MSNMDDLSPDLRSPLRKQLEQILREWTELAENWNIEDRERFDGPQFLYLDSARVVVLRNCATVLKHMLEAIP